LSTPIIASVVRALPPHYHSQAELSQGLQDYWRDGGHTFNKSRVDSIHASVQVRGRHLAIPMADYPPLDTFEKRNTVWIREATRLGEVAVRAAVEKAGLQLKDIDVLCFTSITGLATLRFHAVEERLLAACRTPEETDAVYRRRCVPRKAALDLIYQQRRTLCWDMMLVLETALRPFRHKG
jgi:predicted naringenin-chalcone synthase